MAKADFSRKDKRSVQNVIQPEFIEDSRLKCQVETNKPPSELYFELGHGETKHYRKFFAEEMEQVDELMTY